MTITEEVDGFTEQWWVYIGQRRAADGGALDVYLCLVDGKLDERQRLPFKARRQSKAIGGVYLVQASADGSKAHIKTARYKGLHEDRPLIARWKIEHDAFQTERDLAARERKGKELSLSALDDIRKAYRAAASGSERTCIEVLVLKYLRQIK